MRVLVTGGAGFIGSHVVDALAAAGHEPVIFDVRRPGRRSAGRLATWSTSAAAARCATASQSSIAARSVRPSSTLPSTVSTSPSL